MGVQSEPVRLVDAAGEAGEGAVLDVDDRAALMAHEMGVAVLAQVVERRSVACVHVLDDAELAEALEHAVHGRRRHARSASFDDVDDVIGREMTIGLEQGADDHPRRCGHPAASVTDGLVDHLVARQRRLEPAARVRR